MSTEIIIALVSSITALIIAILTTLLKTPAEKKIERLRHELKQEELIIEADRQRKSQVLDALDHAISLIQEFKDVLQRILLSAETSLDSDLAVEMIKKAQTKLTNEYRDRTAHLHKPDNDLFHTAKGIGFQVESIITTELRHKEYASDLCEDSKRDLQVFRAQLTEIQDVLRDSQSRALMQYLQPIGAK